MGLFGVKCQKSSKPYIWGSFESSWAVENGKNNEKILCPKVDDWAYLGLNVQSPLNYTISGSFESSFALQNGKNNEKNCPQKTLVRDVFKIRKIAK